MRAAALLLISGFIFADDIYQAPSPEPTAEETLILELMNRFRANPKAESEYIVKTFGHGNKIFGAQAKMFLDECATLKSMPPVVFNLQLLNAARKHAYYMVHNGLGHTEEAGKRGFTGVSPSDRTKAAGYPGGAAENAFAQSSGPLNSHARFIVDDGLASDPGGMQPGRGHRMNMIGGHREAGPGAVPNGTFLSVIHNLGSHGPNRFAGGVVYVDLNNNNFYDLGEGKGNVTIMAADGSRVSTWSSGAYALELKSAGAVSMKIDYHGKILLKEFPASPDNINFSFAIPQQTEFDIADKRLADVDKEIADTPSRFKAQVALALAAAELMLDQPRKDRIAAAIGSVGTDLQTAQKSIRDAFTGDANSMRKLLVAPTKTYRGTAAAGWFKEADLAYKAGFAVQNYLKQAATAKPTPSMERDFIKGLEQARDSLQVGEFASRLSVLTEQVRASGGKI